MGSAHAATALLVCLSCEKSHHHFGMDKNTASARFKAALAVALAEATSVDTTYMSGANQLVRLITRIVCSSTSGCKRRPWKDTYHQRSLKHAAIITNAAAWSIAATLTSGVPIYVATILVG